jgi:hypothetical protein
MNAQDALAPLLTKYSAKEQRAITDALKRLHELAVDAGDETLKPRHMGTISENTRPHGAADDLDGRKTDSRRRRAESRAQRMRD